MCCDEPAASTSTSTSTRQGTPVSPAEGRRRITEVFRLGGRLRNTDPEFADMLAKILMNFDAELSKLLPDEISARQLNGNNILSPGMAYQTTRSASAGSNLKGDSVQSVRNVNSAMLGWIYI